MSMNKEEFVELCNDYLNKFKDLVKEKFPKVKSKFRHCNLEFEVIEGEEEYIVQVICPGYSTSNVKFMTDHISVSFQDEEPLLILLPVDFFEHYELEKSEAVLKDGILRIRAFASPEYFQKTPEDFGDGYQEIMKEFNLTSGKE